MNKAQISAQIAQLQGELKSLFDKHSDSMPTEVYEEVTKRELELKGLQVQLKQANDVERISKENASYFESEAKTNFLPNASGAKPKAEVKGIGSAFVSSAAYATKGAVGFDPSYSVKTLFQTSAGWAPVPLRSDVVALSPQRQLTLLDYLPSQTVAVGVTGYRFMLETTFTDSAAEVAQDGTYAESALALTEQIVAIQKVGTTIPVTDEQLADVAGIEDYLNNRMSYMLKQKFETQILNGSGTGGAIAGLLNYSGILTQAIGAMNVYDAFYAAVTKIRNNGYVEPNLVVINPTDWQQIRLVQTSTGQYLWDSPSMSGPATLFGMAVIVSPVIAAGTALVMDASQVSVLYREGIEFKVTDSHASEFTSGVQRLRADLRGSVACYRAPAMCTVTGLA